MTAPLLEVRELEKTFTLHLQGGVRLPVLRGLDFSLQPGECVALVGASGSGKSTFMRSLYGNYAADGGSIRVAHDGQMLELTELVPHALADVRARTIGYVSQFLRVIPRVAAFEIVLEPLLGRGVSRADAQTRVRDAFARLALPDPLWGLSPTTFSGGEKQRVNLARTLVVDYPILLLDEPTSALDAASRERAIGLLLERKRAGAAMVGIFHDDEVRERLADRSIAFGEPA